MRAAWAAVLLLAAAPGAEAALNQPRPYRDAFPFPDEFAAGGLDRVVSGAWSGAVGPTNGSFGFFDSSGATVRGLSRVCWGPAASLCEASPASDLRVVVRPGGSFGLRTPVAVSAESEAGHALALFMDFGGEKDLNSFGLGRSLVAPVVDGAFAFEPLPRLAGTPVPEEGSWYGLVALDDATTVEVRRGGAAAANLAGKTEPVFFVGEPVVSRFTAETFILPFEDGARLTFRRASEADARAGFNLTRIDRLLGDLDAAGAGADGTANGARADTGLGGYGDLLAAVMDGAVVGFAAGEGDAGAAGEDPFLLVRFTRLEAESADGDILLSGPSPLHIQDGRVHGAAPLHGFAFYAMPWWSYLLWGLALAALVARLVLRPPRKSERWDRFRLVGRLAGIGAFALVFVLWDLETRAVWGTSILSFDARGLGIAIVALLQLVPMGAAMFATAAPLRLLLRSASLLARQGTFMGLAGPVANLLGYLLGAHLLRAYLDLYVARVIDSLGG